MALDLGTVRLAVDRFEEVEKLLVHEVPLVPVDDLQVFCVRISEFGGLSCCLLLVEGPEELAQNFGDKVTASPIRRLIEPRL